MMAAEGAPVSMHQFPGRCDSIACRGSQVGDLGGSVWGDRSLAAANQRNLPGRPLGNLVRSAGSRERCVENSLENPSTFTGYGPKHEHGAHTGLAFVLWRGRSAAPPLDDQSIQRNAACTNAEQKDGAEQHREIGSTGVGHFPKSVFLQDRDFGREDRDKHDRDRWDDR